MFSMDSTEITETDKDEYGLLNVSIKEEPLDLYESIPCEVTIKDEPEDINEFEDPFINFDNFDYQNILKTSPETTPISGSDEKVQVQCPRCKNSVLMDNFREHIDLCPPRRKYEFNTVEGDLKCTNNVLDSQFTRRKSLNEVELQKNVSSPRTTRSKSFGRQLNNGKNKGNETNVGVDLNVVKVENHASQIAYYQKLLKIRSKSSVSHTLDNSKLSDSDGIESVSIQSVKVDNHDETFDGSLLLQDNTFACSLCSYTTDKLRNLRDHERSHRLRNQPISKCVYCNQKYTNYALYLHIRKVHPGQKFVLPDDDKKNVDTSKEITSDGTIARPICSYTTDNPKAEKIPKDVFKDIKQETFSCSICSYTTHNQRNLRNHNRAHRIHGKPIFQCIYCNEKYTQHALSLHTRNVHPGQEVMLPDQGEPIPKDVDPFQETKRISMHKIFRCQKCPFYAKTRIVLTEHMADNHSTSDQSKLRCNKCSYSTNKRHNMSKHQNLHGKNVVVSKCRWCDYRAFPKGLWAHKAKCPNVPIEPSEESVVTKHPRTRNKTTANKVDESSNKDCDDDDKLLNDDKSESLKTFPKGIWAHNAKCPNVPMEPSKESVVTTQRVITKHPRTRNKTTANEVDESSNKDCHDDDDKLLNDDKSESLKTFPKGFCAHKAKCPNVPIEPSKESVVITQRVITTHPRTGNKITANEVDESSNKDCDDDKLLNDDKSESLKTVYNCKLCSMRCTTLTAFRQHVRCHARKQPINKCSLCDFKSTPACLREHIREQNHYTKKGLIKTIKCTLCSVLFASKRALGLHLKDHGQNLTKKCSQCNFKSTAIYLAKHVRDKQHYAKNFQCTLCAFSTSLRIRLNMHMKKRHPDSMESTKKTSGKRKKPEKKFSCKFCSYTTPFEFVWEKHVQSHIIYNKPIFQCLECGFKGTKSKIACHKKCGDAPPKKVSLSCAQCSFTTHFPGALSAHEKNDHGDTKIIKTIKVGSIKSFQCELCSFSTYWQYLFEKHMDSHTVLKLPVEQCPNCDFRSTPACLTAHRKKCIKISPLKRP